MILSFAICIHSATVLFLGCVNGTNSIMNFLQRSFKPSGTLLCDHLSKTSTYYYGHILLVVPNDIKYFPIARNVYNSASFLFGIPPTIWTTKTQFMSQNPNTFETYQQCNLRNAKRHVTFPGIYALLTHNRVYAILPPPPCCHGCPDILIFQRSSFFPARCLKLL